MSIGQVTERRPRLIRPVRSGLIEEEKPQAAGHLPGLQLFYALTKASLFGAAGAFCLQLMSFIPIQYLAFFLMPGFMVVFMAAGLLAALFVDETAPLETYKRAGEIGWLAGFWAGVHSGNLATLLAAAGLIMDEFGRNVVLQLTPEQLNWAAGYGFDEPFIALTARVFGALLVYGFIGSLISAIFGTVGGMLYRAVSYSAGDASLHR